MDDALHAHALLDHLVVQEELRFACVDLHCHASLLF